MPFSCKHDQKVSSNANNFTIKNDKCEKVLGVKFDSESMFNQHISDLCKKASKNVEALARITLYMNLQKRRLLK